MVVIKHVVQHVDREIRLDRWFHRHYSQISFLLIAKLIRKGVIKLNGKRTKISERIVQDQVITLPHDISEANRYDTTTSSDGDYKKNTTKCDYHSVKLQTKLVSTASKINVVYVHDDFIAIDKPHGLATQGGTGVMVSVDCIKDQLLHRVIYAGGDTNANTVCSNVEHHSKSYGPQDVSSSPIYGAMSCDVDDSADKVHYASQFQKDNCQKLKIVHRLDKETTGVLILARCSYSAAKISALIRDGRMHKKYIAILCGVPDECEGVVNLAIHDKSAAVSQSEGKYAITRYKVLSNALNYSLVEFEPMTGRTHQLRIHSAALGCPILGDRKYNIMSERLYIERVYKTQDKTLDCERQYERQCIPKNSICENSCSKNIHGSDEHTTSLYYKKAYQNKLPNNNAVLLQKAAKIRHATSLAKKSHHLHLHAWKVLLELDGQNHVIVAQIPQHFREASMKFGLSLNQLE